MREGEKKCLSLKQLMKTASNKTRSRLGRKLVAIRKANNNLKMLNVGRGTVSGALARHIRHWTRQLTAEQLEFYALHMPTDAWRQLADICHLNPEKDFLGLPWFLRYCFDEGAAPDDALVSCCKGISADNVNEYVLALDVPYAHIKRYAPRLRDESKARIAKYTTDLDTVLWLSAGEGTRLPYGKLLERLLAIRKFRKNAPGSASFYNKLIHPAEAMLKDVKVQLDSPVVVIGDASPSMDVAIEVAVIISSLLRSITNARLVFFCDHIVEPPFIPKNVEQVLELAMTMKTDLGTCPASALWPFFEKKEIVKTFILVTDEEENSRYTIRKKSFTFRMLFEQYYKKVYPSKLVFVSFLKKQHDAGQMVSQLRSDGHNILQFKLDKNRPDLSKLNNLVGQLALESKDFESEISQLQEQLKVKHLQQELKEMELNE